MNIGLTAAMMMAVADGLTGIDGSSIVIALVTLTVMIGLFQILPRVGYAKNDATWLCRVQTAEPEASVNPPAGAQPITERATATESVPPTATPAAVDSVVPVDSSSAADSIPAADSSLAADSVPPALPDTSGNTVQQ